MGSQLVVYVLIANFVFFIQRNIYIPIAFSYLYQNFALLINFFVF